MQRTKSRCVWPHARNQDMARVTYAAVLSSRSVWSSLRHTAYTSEWKLSTPADYNVYNLLSILCHSAPIPTHIVLLANLWSSWAAPICRAVMPTPCSTTSRRWSYIHTSITTHWTMILPWCSSTDTSPGRQRLLRLFPSRTAACRCRHHAWSPDGESWVMWVYCICYISYLCLFICVSFCLFAR